jgi:hypothetical protein
LPPPKTFPWSIGLLFSPNTTLRKEFAVNV